MNNLMRTLLILGSVAALVSVTYAAVTQQECDGEKSTCCMAVGFSSVPPMWVKYATCPQGMADDASCILQSGCKKIDGKP